MAVGHAPSVQQGPSETRRHTLGIYSVMDDGFSAAVQDEAGDGAGCGLPSPCSPACRTVERAREANQRRGSRLPRARRSSTNHRSESAATEASHTDGPGRSTVVSVRDDGGGCCALVYHLDHLFGPQFDDATGEGDGWSQVLVPSTSVASFSCMHQNYQSLSL